MVDVQMQKYNIASRQHHALAKRYLHGFLCLVQQAHVYFCPHMFLHALCHHTDHQVLKTFTEFPLGGKGLDSYSTRYTAVVDSVR